MEVTLKVAEGIPQNCTCEETACLKLINLAAVRRLTSDEQKRVWTVRSYDEGAVNRLEYGIGRAADESTLGFVLMPVQIKLPSTDEEEDEGRTWKCPECGTTVELTYDQIVENGSPACPKDGCNAALVLVDPDACEQADAAA